MCQLLFSSLTIENVTSLAVGNAPKLNARTYLCAAKDAEPKENASALLRVSSSYRVPDPPLLLFAALLRWQI
jgi:hypothetical protein